mmetsp:Transcript_20154/g.57450  ORF Transcript_20154/g.57450 Transcript_20154/m.57450 type:complete len:334 (-) Transcript_20154:655-1656(-)
MTRTLACSMCSTEESSPTNARTTRSPLHALTASDMSCEPLRRPAVRVENSSSACACTSRFEHWRKAASQTPAPSRLDSKRLLLALSSTLASIPTDRMADTTSAPVATRELCSAVCAFSKSRKSSCSLRPAAIAPSLKVEMSFSTMSLWAERNSRECEGKVVLMAYLSPGKRARRSISPTPTLHSVLCFIPWVLPSTEVVALLWFWLSVSTTVRKNLGFPCRASCLATSSRRFSGTRSSNCVSTEMAAERSGSISECTHCSTQPRTASSTAESSSGSVTMSSKTHTAICCRQRKPAALPDELVISLSRAVRLFFCQSLSTGRVVQLPSTLARRP